jgi:hypothetical protein
MITKKLALVFIVSGCARNLRALPSKVARGTAHYNNAGARRGEDSKAGGMNIPGACDDGSESKTRALGTLPGLRLPDWRMGKPVREVRTAPPSSEGKRRFRSWSTKRVGSFRPDAGYCPESPDDCQATPAARLS